MEKKKPKIRQGVWEESGVFRCRFMVRGQRYFQTLPDCKNRTEAKAERDRLKTLARAGKLKAGESAASTNFKRFVEEIFLPHVQANKQPGTAQSYGWRCADLVAVFGKLDLPEVSTFAVEKFKREQRKRRTIRGSEQSPASVNRYLQILASVFTHAEKLGLIRADQRPAIETLREDNQRIRYLTTGEEQRLLAAAANWPHLHDLIVIGLATGLRREELFGLKKSDIDFSLNLITILVTKSGKARRVPLDPAGEPRRILERRSRESGSGFVFTSPHSGRKLTRVTKSLAAACKAAELDPPITLHTLRHTFCTRLAAAGVDVRTIQELAGHQDVSTTMRYTHLVESNAHEAIARLSRFATDCHKFATAEVIEMKSKTG